MTDDVAYTVHTLASQGERQGSLLFLRPVPGRLTKTVSLRPLSISLASV